MSEKINDCDYINFRVTPKELRYFVSCGLALIQNVPEGSLTTYCGLNKNEIIDISIRLRALADEIGVQM
ncbi:hypothetical protein J1785_19690 [Rahnella sp. SL6]|jgi:hypothetical protein|uniref:hypothetical protein n=1 Tax=Rahnella TaxID=34037 RepID=UPI001C280B7F|nr:MULTISPECIES: hypothetical protein [Rahnella]MBU9811940.1 hypothetical protein [Rahnella perminowiae]MBU9848892.1 hypothetical protein [Rahnella aceris]